MNGWTNIRRRLPWVGVPVGGFLLAWGALSIVLPVHYVTTVAPLDAVLTSIAYYFWPPALGLLLVTLSLFAVLEAKAAQSPWWSVGLTGIGAGLLLLGMLLTFLTLNRVLGIVFLSPLLLTGGVLVVAGTHGRVTVTA